MYGAIVADRVCWGAVRAANTGRPDLLRRVEEGAVSCPPGWGWDREGEGGPGAWLKSPARKGVSGGGQRDDPHFNAAESGGGGERAQRNSPFVDALRTCDLLISQHSVPVAKVDSVTQGLF